MIFESELFFSNTLAGGYAVDRYEALEHQTPRTSSDYLHPAPVPQIHTKYLYSCNIWVSVIVASECYERVLTINIMWQEGEENVNDKSDILALRARTQALEHKHSNTTYWMSSCLVV